MLLQHSRWSTLFSNLKYIVIDEAHMYRYIYYIFLIIVTDYYLCYLVRGIFGSHVSCVIKRLVRVCLHYTSILPQFVMLSATISNPEQHMVWVYLHGYIMLCDMFDISEETDSISLLWVWQWACRYMHSVPWDGWLSFVWQVHH